MSLEQHRNDISDSAWEKIKPHTIGEWHTWRKRKKIQNNLLMGYLGFCEQELHGETFQQNMDIGKMFIADFVSGETKEFWQIF